MKTKQLIAIVSAAAALGFGAYTHYSSPYTIPTAIESFPREISRYISNADTSRAFTEELAPFGLELGYANVAGMRRVLKDNVYLKSKSNKGRATYQVSGMYFEGLILEGAELEFSPEGRLIKATLEFPEYVASLVAKHLTIAHGVYKPPEGSYLLKEEGSSQLNVDYLSDKVLVEYLLKTK